jgi:fucose permease
MKLKAVHLLAVFIMVYIGVEITAGGIICSPILYLLQQKFDRKSGWIVTFMMIVRGGGPLSGYVSTGFFGGKYLVIPSLSSVKYFFKIRSYFGPCRLGRGD